MPRPRRSRGSSCRSAGSACRFNRGNRLFVDAKLPLVQDLSLNVFYGRAVGTDYAVANRPRVDVVIGYHALKALQRAGAL